MEAPSGVPDAYALFLRLPGGICGRSVLFEKVRTLIEM
jgi:hypothetical protein